MKVLGKVLYLCTRQNIQVSPKYSNGLLTLNLLPLLSTPQDAPTGGRGRRAGREISQPLCISLRPTSMQQDGFKNWWCGLRNCCIQWEQGRFRNKCTDLLESGIVCSSQNVDVLLGMSVCSRSLKCHQGSLPFSVVTRHRTRYGHTLQD